MSDHDFPVFPQPDEDARALLARLYREIGVSAVAAELNLDDTPEATLAQKARDRLARIREQTRRILAA